MHGRSVANVPRAMSFNFGEPSCQERDGSWLLCYKTSIFISFLDYWQLLIGDTSTIYYTDVAIRVTMTLY